MRGGNNNAAAKQRLAVDEEPVLVGTLSKRAQGKSTFGRMNWKQRWFVLYNKELQWWSLEGGRYNASSELKGSIDLASVTAVEYVSYDAFTRAHMFQVVHRSILYIQCSTKAECQRWVAALRELVCNNEYLHPKFHPGFFDEKDKVWSCCGIPSRDFKGCLSAYNYTALRESLARRLDGGPSGSNGKQAPSASMGSSAGGGRKLSGSAGDSLPGPTNDRPTAADINGQPRLPRNTTTTLNYDVNPTAAAVSKSQAALAVKSFRPSVDLGDGKRAPRLSESAPPAPKRSASKENISQGLPLRHPIIIIKPGRVTYI